MRHVAFSLLSFLSLLLSSALLASSMSEDTENSGDAPTRPPITGSKSARKKEHKRRAVEAYLAIDGDAQPSLREWWSKHCVKPRSAGNHQQLNEDVSNRHRVCFATFCTGVKTKLQEERPAGRPRTFTDEEEQMIVKAVREAEACMTFLTPSIIQQEVWHVAILPREDEKNDIAAWQAGIKQRISRCSSERFIRSFCARHRITGKKGRPMETYRAAKMQPEIIVQHFRLIFHTWALCQIQRAIVRDDRIVPGWHVPPAGLVTRDDGSGHDPGPDMLEMRDGTMFVIPLDEPLEALPNDCRMAADEKPLCPDSPVKKQLSAYGTRIVYMSRSKWWTVMPWFAGDRVKLFTVLVPGQSVDSNAARIILKPGECEDEDVCTTGLTATSRGSQTDASMLSSVKAFVEIIREEGKVTRANPGVLVMDGHITHLLRPIRDILESAFIFPVIEPSWLSATLQYGDNGANALIDSLYRKHYTTLLIAHSRTFDDRHRMQALRNTLNDLCSSESREVLRGGWKKIALPLIDATSGSNGMPDLAVFRKAATYAVGTPYREESLPKVNVSLLNAIFSGENLSIPHEGRIELQEPASEELLKWFTAAQCEIHQNVPAGESIVSYFIQRNGRSEATVNQALYGAFLGTEEDFSNRMDTTDDLGIIRGTSCRIATPQGRLLTGASATRELDESAAAAEDRRRAARESAERAAIKTAADMPVKSLLEQLGYLPEGSRMIKNHLQHFIVAHRARWRPKEAVPAITAARESLRDAIAAFIQTVNDRGLISKRVFRRAGRDTTMELRSAIAPKASRKRTVSQMQVTDVTSNDTCEPPAKR